MPLQLNRISRTTFAAKHYSTSRFRSKSTIHLAKWLLSLSDAHLDMLRSVTHETLRVPGFTFTVTFYSRESLAASPVQRYLNLRGVRRDIVSLVKTEEV